MKILTYEKLFVFLAMLETQSHTMLMLQDVGMLIADYLLQGCHKISKRTRGTFGSYLYMTLLINKLWTD